MAQRLDKGKGIAIEEENENNTVVFFTKQLGYSDSVEHLYCDKNSSLLVSNLTKLKPNLADELKDPKYAFRFKVTDATDQAEFEFKYNEKLSGKAPNQTRQGVLSSGWEKFRHKHGLKMDDTISFFWANNKISLRFSKAAPLSEPIPFPNPQTTQLPSPVEKWGGLNFTVQCQSSTRGTVDIIVHLPAPTASDTTFPVAYWITSPSASERDYHEVFSGASTSRVAVVGVPSLEGDDWVTYPFVVNELPLFLIKNFPKIDTSRAVFAGHSGGNAVLSAILKRGAVADSHGREG